MNYGIKNLLDAYNSGVTEGMNIALNEFVVALKKEFEGAEVKGLSDATFTLEEVLEKISSTAMDYAQSKNK